MASEGHFTALYETGLVCFKISVNANEAVESSNKRPFLSNLLVAIISPKG